MLPVQELEVWSEWLGMPFCTMEAVNGGGQWNTGAMLEYGRFMLLIAQDAGWLFGCAHI